LLHCSLAVAQQRRRPFSFSFFAALQLNCSAAKKKAFFFLQQQQKKKTFFFFFFATEEEGFFFLSLSLLHVSHGL